MLDESAFHAPEVVIQAHPSMTLGVKVPQGAENGFPYDKTWTDPQQAMREWAATFLDGADMEWIEEGELDGYRDVVYGWSRDVGPDEWIAVNLTLIEVFPYVWIVSAIHAWHDADAAPPS